MAVYGLLCICLKLAHAPATFTSWASSCNAVYMTLQVSRTAVKQGQVRSRPGGLLLEALMALPDLAGKP